MQAIKYSLASVLVSTGMVVGLAGPVAADTVTDSHNSTTNVSVNDTKTITKTDTNSGIIQKDGENQIAIQGNCSGVFYVTITQSQAVSQSNNQSNSAGGQDNSATVKDNNGSDQTNSLTNNNSQNLSQSNSNSQVQTVSQIATGVNFSPNCSVNQVAGGAGAGGQGANTSAGAGGAGAVLAASTTSPSVLPNTGIKLGAGVWSSLAVVAFGLGSLYWREIVSPAFRRK